MDAATSAANGYPFSRREARRRPTCTCVYLGEICSRPTYLSIGCAVHDREPDQ